MRPFALTLCLSLNIVSLLLESGYPNCTKLTLCSSSHVDRDRHTVVRRPILVVFPRHARLITREICPVVSTSIVARAAISFPLVCPLRECLLDQGVGFEHNLIELLLKVESSLSIEAHSIGETLGSALAKQ